MASEGHIQILRSGVTNWNSWRQKEPQIAPDLSGAKLLEADLRRADLSDCDFTGATLYKANLTQADISKAKIVQAKLTGATLCNAYLCDSNLSESDLANADFTDANLSNAKLSSAILNQANFEGAKLFKTDLTGAVISEANLRSVDLNQSDLSMCRLIRTDLTDAVVENAIVTDVHIEELKGMPRPPSRLWEGVHSKTLIEGESAKYFFQSNIFFEVHINKRFDLQVLGCYCFHVGEVYGKVRGSQKVVFLGSRPEDKFEVLCFSTTSREVLYDLLPEFMAPFLQFSRVKWEKVAELANESEKPSNETTTQAPLPPPGISEEKEEIDWELARSMAKFFPVCREGIIFSIKQSGKALYNTMPNPVVDLPFDEASEVPGEPGDEGNGKKKTLDLSLIEGNPLVHVGKVSELEQSVQALSGNDAHTPQAMQQTLDKAKMSKSLKEKIKKLVDDIDKLSQNIPEGSSEEEEEGEVRENPKDALMEILKAFVDEAARFKPRPQRYSVIARALMNSIESFGPEADECMDNIQDILEALP